MKREEIWAPNTERPPRADLQSSSDLGIGIKLKDRAKAGSHKEVYITHGRGVL